LLDSLLQEKAASGSMDVPALLVFVGGFAVCCGVVFLISILGAKEQTFEEALAAQKKKNEKEKVKGKKEKKDQGDKKTKSWRKKKGDRDDKVDNLDDGEEEPVIIVPSTTKESLIVEEPLLVEEPTPEPSPEPTPEPTPEPVKVKKEKKKAEEKKKRIEIQEVTEIIEEQIEVAAVEEEPIIVEETEPAEAAVADNVEAVHEPVVEEEMVEVVAQTIVEAVKPSPVKQTKNKKSKAEGGSNPKDLLSVIKKTAFNDAEAQEIIDVLLTKQSGDMLNSSEEWIEKGKPSESQKLKLQLGEMEKSLNEEQVKGKSLQDKLTSLRVELNQEKAAKASHNRAIEEINARQSNEVNIINNKMQGFINENSMLKGQLNQIQMQIRDVESMRVGYQATIDNLSQQLQMSHAAVANAEATNPHLLSELEQLRTLRDKYEVTLAELSSNNSTLTSQLSSQTEELTSVKSQLSSQTDELVGMKGQLVGREDEKTQMAGVEAALHEKTEEANALVAAKTDLEAELVRVKSLGESLQQQLAAVPPPAAAPAPEVVVEKVTVADPAVEAELVAVKSRLADKEQEAVRLMEENERLSEQLASSVERPAADGEEAGEKSEVNGHAEAPVTESPEVTIAAEKAAAAVQQAEEWREKFEVLHMEHEKMMAKQKMFQTELEDERGSFKGELESMKSKNNELTSSLQTSKELLVRLFPSLTLDQDLPTMETMARSSLEAMSPSPVEDNSAELDRLEGQVTHYKTVLSQTESMLNSLQASVEAAEDEWRGKLDAANKELTEVKKENSCLNTKVASTASHTTKAEEVA